jgi:hypothetical protein
MPTVHARGMILRDLFNTPPEFAQCGKATDGTRDQSSKPSSSGGKELEQNPAWVVAVSGHPLFLVFRVA